MKDAPPTPAELVEIRTALGLSRREFASALGISYPSIFRLEEGKHSLQRAWEYADIVARLRALRKKARSMTGGSHV